MGVPKGSGPSSKVNATPPGAPYPHSRGSKLSRTGPIGPSADRHDLTGWGGAGGVSQGAADVPPARTTRWRSIIGKQNQTAIGTLVERQTGYAMLLHLPDGYKPEQVRDALAEKIKTLPTSLRLSLTWDQGSEMRDWKQVSVDADIDIYFCDPHSPWQRGTNENFNGLLRQYFRKGTDLGVYSSDDLDWVAQELNDRPRKRLAFKKPIELIGDLLLR